MRSGSSSIRDLEGKSYEALTHGSELQLRAEAHCEDYEVTESGLEKVVICDEDTELLMQAAREKANEINQAYVQELIQQMDEVSSVTQEVIAETGEGAVTAEQNAEAVTEAQGLYQAIGEYTAETFSVMAENYREIGQFTEDTVREQEQAFDSANSTVSRGF